MRSQILKQMFEDGEQQINQEKISPRKSFMNFPQDQIVLSLARNRKEKKNATRHMKSFPFSSGHKSPAD